MSSEKEIKILNDEWNLIKLLRDEAKEVKDCYTRFSFQALTFTVAILGLTFNLVEKQFYTAFISLSSTIILLAVARIGTFKYGTANRNFGFDLHLHLTRNLTDPSPIGWEPHMRTIGWEEAMRAWRVVQATMFAFLYITKGPNRLKKPYRSIKNKWFEPKSLIPKTSGSKYYAGSYLKTMNSFLHLMAIFSLSPIFYITYRSYQDHSDAYIYYGLIAITMFFYVLYKMYCNRFRRINLEEGLLSIHSCATTWLLVTVAHFRALDKLKGLKKDITSPTYTTYLAEEANELISNNNIFEIDKWLNRSIET